MTESLNNEITEISEFYRGEIPSSAFKSMTTLTSLS